MDYNHSDQADCKVRHRILAEHAHKYLNQEVVIIGDAVSINTTANTATLRMPDEQTMLVLLPKTNCHRLEPSRLTEVIGRVVSRGSIEATSLHQFKPEYAHKFDTNAYCDMVRVVMAHRRYLEM